MVTFAMMTALHWLIIAAVLLTAEMVVALTGYLLCLGVAAGAVSLAMWTGMISAVIWQWSVFFILGGGLCVLWWWRLQSRTYKSDAAASINLRMQSFINREVTLLEDVNAGLSRVRMDDSTWPVHCPSGMKKGDSVIIKEAKGMSLVAEAKN